MHDSNLHVGVGVSGEFAHGPTRPLIHRHPTLHGFTLVELLVVVTIIVVLLALLVPSLDKAISAAEVALCGSNEHAVGLAMSLYLMDSKQKYPQLPTYSGLMGNPSLHNAQDVRDRPLNAYLNYVSNGSLVAVAQCPSDRGDSFENSQGVAGSTSYERWGTSYLTAWFHNPISRTKAVFGSSNTSPLVGVTSSASHRQFVRTSNKLVLADWPWFGNRHYNIEDNQWHTRNPLDRRFNTLFADWHVELFYFNRDLCEDGMSTDGYGEANNLYVNPANPSNPWW